MPTPYQPEEQEPEAAPKGDENDILGIVGLGSGLN
jgi:hypothetical protein